MTLGTDTLPFPVTSNGETIRGKFGFERTIERIQFGEGRGTGVRSGLDVKIVTNEEDLGLNVQLIEIEFVAGQFIFPFSQSIHELLTLQLFRYF